MCQQHGCGYREARRTLENRYRRCAKGSQAQVPNTWMPVALTSASLARAVQQVEVCRSSLGGVVDTENRDPPMVRKNGKERGRGDVDCVRYSSIAVCIECREEALAPCKHMNQHMCSLRQVSVMMVVVWLRNESQEVVLQLPVPLFRALFSFFERSIYLQVSGLELSRLHVFFCQRQNKRKKHAPPLPSPCVHHLGVTPLASRCFWCSVLSLLSLNGISKWMNICRNTSCAVVPLWRSKSNGTLVVGRVFGVGFVSIESSPLGQMYRVPSPCVDLHVLYVFERDDRGFVAGLFLFPRRPTWLESLNKSAILPIYTSRRRHTHW